MIMISSAANFHGTRCATPLESMIRSAAGLVVQVKAAARANSSHVPRAEMERKEAANPENPDDEEALCTGHDGSELSTDNLEGRDDEEARADMVASELEKQPKAINSSPLFAIVRLTFGPDFPITTCIYTCCELASFWVMTSTWLLGLLSADDWMINRNQWCKVGPQHFDSLGEFNP
eukprot:Skav217301  [mRNA]  locus=scaffold1466:243086:243616:+ [translate_table: standard]